MTAGTGRLGRGDIAAVVKAIGMFDRAIRRGIIELESEKSFPPGRQRRMGAGRRHERRSSLH
jgi:hypothetical protein